MTAPRLLPLAALLAVSISLPAVAAPAPASALRADQLRELLDQAPDESRGIAAGIEIQLPLPDGRMARVRAVRSPILGEALQLAHPEIRTFLASGVDDPRIHARLSVTPLGVHGIVFTPEGTAWIGPPGSGPTDVVSSAWTGDHASSPVECETIESASPSIARVASPTQSWGSERRTLRFILMATGEFTQALGGVAAATARMAVIMNHVSAAFERDVAVRLEVVQLMPFADPDTDPYASIVITALINRNCAVVDSIFGAASYDMGAVITTLAGSTRGLGFRPTICGACKAGSVVATHDPEGVSPELTLGHELGHGIGGSHTQDRDCNRSSESAVETGSGLTILCSMPAACPPDVQPQRETYYHVANLEQFIATLTANPACGTTTVTGNTPPTSDAGPDVTIPRGTPFVLTGAGTDPDAGDVLSYTWEQFDIAPTSFDPILGPLYRWRLPVTEPVRYCPPAASVLSGVPETYEPLVPVDRTLHFRLTVRDNHVGGGGVAWDERVITVAGAPFVVTSPNGGNMIDSSQPFMVTWDVGGASVAPNVNLLLSLDGGASWESLISGTPNDGAEPVFRPTATTFTTCRIKVEAADNIFYDVSNADFSLVGTATPTLLSLLESETRADGILIRWRLADPGSYERVVVERSEPSASSWIEPAGERREEPDASVFIDRSIQPGRSYLYRLEATAWDGTSMRFGPIAAQGTPLAEGFGITRVAPTPAPGALRIEYATPRAAHVRLDVLDVQGRVVAVVVDELQPGGRHEALWSGRGARGRVAGLYYVRLTSGGDTRVRAATLTE
ncbi:MAG TPA: zinc-dependent metalloprotease family protein [Candidatus Eisenbacteria bacterium]|nr:zinc-dependent metalloprotease family protein [Candidatus Eisenbacteria bacterium]